MNLGKQTTNPVGDPGDLAGEVVVVADQDFQLGEGLVTGVDPAQRVRQSPGGIRDHVRVPGVGLGRARMQVSQAAHDQTRRQSSRSITHSRHLSKPGSAGLTAGHRAVEAGS